MRRELAHEVTSVALAVLLALGIVITLVGFLTGFAQRGERATLGGGMFVTGLLIILFTIVGVVVNSASRGAVAAMEEWKPRQEGTRELVIAGGVGFLAVGLFITVLILAALALTTADVFLYVFSPLGLTAIFASILGLAMAAIGFRMPMKYLEEGERPPLDLVTLGVGLIVMGGTLMFLFGLGPSWLFASALSVPGPVLIVAGSVVLVLGLFLRLRQSHQE